MTRKFTFLLMALLALAGFKSWGQETLTVCEGTAAEQIVPVFVNYFDSEGTISQYVIPSNELTAMTGGEITALKFYISYVDVAKLPSVLSSAQVTCKLQEVSSAVVSSIQSGGTQVFSGNLTASNNCQELDCIFDNAYTYQGGNLLVSFEVTDDGDYTWTQFFGINPSYNSAITNRGSDPDVPQKFIPKTTFTYSSCPAPTGLAASNITATGATISWTDNGAESYDLAYGPAATFDLNTSIIYTLVPGLTETSVQLSGLIAETEYKCAVKAHCSDEEESAWSSAVAFLPSTFQHLTVNDGTYVNTNNDSGQVPFNGYNADNYNNKSQFIIPASALEQMADASITDITFYLNTNSSNKEYTYDIFDIYVKEVDYTTVGYTYPEEFASMTKVYTGKLTTSNYQLTIHFDEPYVYGGQNLMVGFNQTSRGTWGYTYWLGKEEGTEMRSRSGYSNSYGSTVNSYTFLPKTTFAYIPGATRYNVEVGYPIGGSISANPTSAAAGTAVNLTATPETEFWGSWEYVYEFGEWVEEYDDVEIVNNQFTMPEHDVFISATFNPVTTYDITINNSTGCIVGASYQDYEITKAPAGTIVTLEAYVDSEYLFDYFTVDGIQISGSTFEMPDHEVTISAVFHEKQIYTITLMANGIVSNSYQVAEGDYTDAYLHEPYIAGTTFKGVTFEGWSYSEIGSYTTERPETIDEDMVATQNVSLHAVFSYSEDVPVAKSLDGYWSKVTDPATLKNGDKVVFVGDNSKILCQRVEYSDTYFVPGNVSVSDNVITNIPDNAIEFTLQSDGDNWKLNFVDNHNGETTLAYAYYNDLLPKNFYTGGPYQDTWTAVSNSGAVVFKETNNTSSTSAKYIAYNSSSNPEKIQGNSLSMACQVYKAGLPYVTNTYYMTNVLTDGYVEEDTQVKNIIITSDNTYGIGVYRTLELDANGLFRNDDAEKFVFFVDDGAQFIYGGGETVKAKFYKEISAYTNEEGRDGYYLLANPTHNTTVENLDTYQYDLYRFDPAQQKEWINIHPTSLDDDPVIDRETGYLYACNYSKTIEFIGNLLPAGSTEFELVYAEKELGGFNLLGNPYACNVYLNKPAYRLNAAGGEFIPVEGSVNPCEGFFVEATAANQSVTLSTAAPEAPASLLSLTVSQNRGNVIDRAIVSFDESNNLHKFMMNPAHTNLSIAKGGETFAAISTEAEGELPVNFKAEKDGTYTISVNTENVEANYLHLIDNLTGMDTDLLSTPSYTFNATTSDYASRFKLVFSMNNVENNQVEASCFAYISNGELIISNEGRATLQVIDVMGRIVRNQQIEGDARISTEGLTAGVYVLNLNGNVQKIVVR